MVTTGDGTDQSYSEVEALVGYASRSKYLLLHMAITVYSGNQDDDPHRGRRAAQRSRVSEAVFDELCKTFIGSKLTSAGTQRRRFIAYNSGEVPLVRPIQRLLGMFPRNSSMCLGEASFPRVSHAPVTISHVC